MLRHLFPYEIKQLFRDRTGLFFGIVLPLALGFMYHFALGNLVTDNIEDNTYAAVVNVNQVDSILIDNLSQVGGVGEIVDEEIIHDSNQEVPIIFISTDENQAKDLLKNEIVDAVIYGVVENNTVQFQVEMAPSSINSLKSDLIYYALNSYQTVANNISQGMNENQNPLLFGTQVFQLLNNHHDEIVKNKDSKEINSEAIYFYAIIGYVCMYFLTLGMETVNKHDSYSSEAAKRLNISPVPRLKRFVVTFITYWIPGLLTIYFLVSFYWSQGVPLGNNAFDLFLILTAGATAGYLTGVAIASHFKLGEGPATAITIALPLTLGAFSGMMSGSLKAFADQQFPWLNKFNPIALVSNGLYYLTHYPTKDAFYQNIYFLLVYILIFAAISIIGLRRDFHENI